MGLLRGTSRDDRVLFERLGFALEPEAPYEIRPDGRGGMGCEDPRVTFVPILDRFVMTYTGFGPAGPRIAIALSVDGYTWERLGLVDFASHGLPDGDDKDGGVFPGARAFAGGRALARVLPPADDAALDGGWPRRDPDAAPDAGQSARIASASPTCRSKRCQPTSAICSSPPRASIVLSPDGPWGRLKDRGGNAARAHR